MRRVVITGMGAVAPHGRDVESIWARVARGESAVDRIQAFDPSGLLTQIAAEARWDLETPDREGPFPLDFRGVQSSWTAAREALDQAGLGIDESQRPRRAVVVATGSGDTILSMLGEAAFRVMGPGQDANPRRLPLAEILARFQHSELSDRIEDVLLDTVPPLLAQMLGADQVYDCVSACASGSQALTEGASLIARGDADVALVGGACWPVNEALIGGFALLGALSRNNDNPAAASRPFDKGRDGFIVAEGVALLVLESAESAAARGATVLAELSGWGLSADSYRITDPEPGGVGMAMAMRRALERASVGPEAVSYINAHGTSTRFNDAAETKAIKKVFGERGTAPPVSSSKSMFGHLIHGAGALEAIVCIKAMQDGVLPPTINQETADPACDLDYIPEPRPAQVDRCLSNSFGFGGQNASVLLTHPRILEDA